MEKIQSYFVALAAMTDTAILEMLDAVENQSVVTSAFLRAEIMQTTGNTYRRLRAAIGMTVDQLVLAMENVEFLTDVEIQRLFIKAAPDTRAQFVVAVFNDATENGRRAKRLLEGVQDILNTEKAEAVRKAEEEAEAARVAEKARVHAHLLVHPEDLVRAILKGFAADQMDDEIAMAYLQRRPMGTFEKVSDLLGLITVPENGVVQDGEMVDMYSGEVIAVNAARVLRYCFVTSEPTAKRLVKLLPSRADGKKNRYYHVVTEAEEGSRQKGLLEFLTDKQVETKAEEEARVAARKKVEEARAAKKKAIVDRYEAEYDVVPGFAGFAANVATKEKLLADPEYAEYRGLINKLCYDKEGDLYQSLRRRLSINHPDLSNRDKLESEIIHRNTLFESLPEATPQTVKDAFQRQTSVMARHLQWLEDREARMQQAPQANGNGVAKKPRVGTHTNTKGDPGASVLTKKKNESAELVRRGRKLALSSAEFIPADKKFADLKAEDFVKIAKGHKKVHKK